MGSYLKRIRPVCISRDRENHPHATVDDSERSESRSLAGTLLYLGQAVSPQAWYMASRIQQRLLYFTVKHPHEENDMVKEICSLHYFSTFPQPEELASISVCTFSDASSGRNNYAYGQTGLISGLRIRSRNSNVMSYRPLVCSSHKQRRVFY